MRYRRIVAVLLVLVIASAVLISIRRRSHPKRTSISINNGYRFGLVTVDTVAARITFPARVARDTGYVRTLIYLAGYPWLKDLSAIVSPARLIDLQKGIASLDWALWDSLWNNLRPRRQFSITLAAGGELDASRAVMEENETLGLSSYIFLGAPEFDAVVLERREDINCLTCPAFEREQQAITELLRRKSGIIGYRLHPNALPKPGSELQVILKLKPSEEHKST